MIRPARVRRRWCDSSITRSRRSSRTIQKDFAKTLADFAEFTSHYRPDGATFLALTPNEQIDAIGELERLEPDVFRDLRGVTMTGMFAHPEHGGNFGKIGWRLIGYEDRYSWAPPFGYYDRGRE